VLHFYSDLGPCDKVNICKLNDKGEITAMKDMTHEQFLGALLQEGISVPYHKYEMPKIN